SYQPNTISLSSTGVNDRRSKHRKSLQSGKERTSVNEDSGNFHEDNKEHKCEQCGRIFRNAQCLERHH
ncbi:hypothetical protein PMAYCL1PPCAC_14094, partial [Pristionchus mayeri]